MKKLYALLVVAFSVSSLAVAAPNTHSVDPPQRVDSNEKVVPITPSQITIEVADFNTALSFNLLDVRDARATAVTKTIEGGASLHLKATYRDPVIETCLIGASPLPADPLGPDNPASAAVQNNTPWPAWRMPADYDPTAIEGRQRSVS